MAERGEPKQRVDRREPGVAATAVLPRASSRPSGHPPISRRNPGRRVDLATERNQLTGLAAVKANRDQDVVTRRLDELLDAAKEPCNLRSARACRWSMGKVCGRDARRLRAAPAGI